MAFPFRVFSSIARTLLIDLYSVIVSAPVAVLGGGDGTGFTRKKSAEDGGLSL